MKVLSSDIIRGHIDTIVLSVLLKGELYGVEIRKAINDKTNGLYQVSEQTLYSSFHRLEDGGFIKGFWGDEMRGSTRKYYRITPRGVELYSVSVKEWENSKRLIDILISQN